MSACARVKPDSALAKIVGLGPMPKHRVLSKVELYIDMKRLEDSVNQAFIVPNGPLARVFGSKRRVRRDAVPKLLEQHVS
ncbi:MAG: SWIB/MDM2 domain-containing protein [Planctomycetes bacterium]|nr:SWIB/MDM2 domain-containing protein [Planctomycetota bacterium]